MMIHLCYFSQASKITENHRFLFYQRRLLSIINLMSSHLVKWWRFYWGVEDSTGLFYPLYTVEYHSSKRQNMKKKSKKYKKIILLFIKRPFLNCKKLRHYYNIELLQKKLPINNLGLQSPACEVSAWEAQAHV